MGDDARGRAPPQPAVRPREPPDVLGKLPRSGPDGVVLDLEDAVPADAKRDARPHARAVGAELARGASAPGGVRARQRGPDRVVRRRHRRRRWHPELAGIVVPEARVGRAGRRRSPARSTRAGLGAPARRCRDRDRARRRRARASSSARRWRSPTSAPRTSSPTWAACAPSRAPRCCTRGRASRSPARIAGVLALDQVVTTARRRRRASSPTPRRAAPSATAGKLCIHPAQVPLANRAFSPSPEELDRARRLLAAYDDAVRTGRGRDRLRRARWSTSRSPATPAPCSPPQATGRFWLSRPSRPLRRLPPCAPRTSSSPTSRHASDRSRSSSPRHGGSRTPNSSPEADARRTARRARPARAARRRRRCSRELRAAARARTDRRRPARRAASSTCCTTRSCPTRCRPTSGGRSSSSRPASSRPSTTSAARSTAAGSTTTRSPRSSAPATTPPTRRAAWEAAEADRPRGRRAHPRARAAPQPGRTRPRRTATTSRSRSPPASSTRQRLFATLDDVDRATAGAVRGVEGRARRSRSPARFGCSPDELRPWHSTTRSSRARRRMARSPLDHLFVDADLEALTLRTYDGLGLDVRPVLEHSDLYARDGKSQHAFCIDIDRSGDVRVLCNVEPSERWMDTMLHEFGHAIYDRECDTVAPVARCAAPRTRSPPRASRCSWAASRATRSGCATIAAVDERHGRRRSHRRSTAARRAALAGVRALGAGDDELRARASTPIPTPTSTRSGGTSSSATSTCAGPTAATRPTGRRRSTSRSRPSTTRTTCTASCSRRSCDADARRHAPAAWSTGARRRCAARAATCSRPARRLRWDQLVDRGHRRAVERRSLRRGSSYGVALMDLGLRAAPRSSRAATRGVGPGHRRAARRRGLPGRGARAHAEATSARPRTSCWRRAPRTRSGSSATCSTPARSRRRSRSSTSAGASATCSSNTVGPAHVGGLDDLTDAAWLDEFELGVLTMIRTTRAALPLLRKATFARIVNVAASSIRHQSPGLIGFTAAKAAMASASKNLSRALAPEGIIVNTVAPGTVMSPTLASYLVGTDLEGLPEGPLEAAYEAIARDYGASNDIGRVGLPEEVARPWSLPLLRALPASSSAPPSRSTAAPTSSDPASPDAAGSSALDGVQPRRPVGTVADAIPDREALVCGDRRLTYADADDARHPARAPPRRSRHRSRRPRRALPLQRHRVPRRHARRVQAARGPDQRELPLRRGGAALPPRRLPTPRRSCSTASSRRSSARSAPTCRSSPPSSWSTTAPACAVARARRAPSTRRALAAASPVRDFGAALRRRPLHPLHRAAPPGSPRA